MSTCSFCGNQIERGTGKMFVYNTGKILWFCGSKCEKNMLKLKRTPQNFKWTSSYEKGKVVEQKPSTQ